jgi:hypothetical protein
LLSLRVISHPTRVVRPDERQSRTGGNMSTRTQMFVTLGVTAAFMAATVLMPEAADAGWWWKPKYKPPTAPEIDPSTVSSAIALAMGGLAVLKDKIRRR